MKSDTPVRPNSVSDLVSDGARLVIAAGAAFGIISGALVYKAVELFVRETLHIYRAIHAPVEQPKQPPKKNEERHLRIL